MPPISTLKSLIHRKGSNDHPLSPGVYHYQNQDKNGKARLHLRVESDGNGLLLVNASRIYHFNPTATYMAYLILEKTPQAKAITELIKRYHVTKKQVYQDFVDFNHKIQTIIEPGDSCPNCDLELEVTMPFSTRPSAPYRMDLALTYHCNNDCAHCYNDRPRQYPELTTTQWKQILDKLWDIGIPHIIFTGGEPTLRHDLPELIAHAEHNGQITGINTNGRKLKDTAYTKELVSAGLDHAQITLESHDPMIHDEMVRMPGAYADTLAGIKNALASNLFVMTNTTLLQKNSAYLDQTLNFLADLGVPTVGLNTLIYAGGGLNIKNGLPEADLYALMEIAKDTVTRRNQKLIWYTPTQYCHFNPLDSELGVKGCTAALYNMCIEPDGSVIPCQSYYHSLGNLLTQDWDSIWNHELAVSLRERRNLPFACNTCTLIQECGGGCPLARQAGMYSNPIPIYSPLPLDMELSENEPIK